MDVPQASGASIPAAPGNSSLHAAVGRFPGPVTPFCDGVDLLGFVPSLCKVTIPRSARIVKFYF